MSSAFQLFWGYQTINKCCPQFSVTLQALWTAPAQRDCKPDGTSLSGISPNLWGKKCYPVIRDIILSGLFVWYIVLVVCFLFFVFSWGITYFRVVVGGWELQDLAQQRSQHSAWGAPPASSSSPSAFFFFFFFALMRLSCLQAASLQVLKGSEFNHIKEQVLLPMNYLCFLCYQWAEKQIC